LKTIAILQSNYIPWKGYFDLIASVDEFILYDDVQYTRRDWRNRNLIKTPAGTHWLSVPVRVKGRYHQTIRETELDGTDWAERHWSSLVANYRRAPYFDSVAEWLQPYFQDMTFTHLSELNGSLIAAVCSYLGVATRIRSSADYELPDGKTERLVSICRDTGASRYVSGPAARAYIDTQLFEDAEIDLCWFEYGDYPEYPQLWGSFVHQVTVLDLLFNCGQGAPRYMKYVHR